VKGFGIVDSCFPGNTRGWHRIRWVLVSLLILHVHDLQAWRRGMLPDLRGWTPETAWQALLIAYFRLAIGIRWLQ